MVPIAYMYACLLQVCECLCVCVNVCVCGLSGCMCVRGHACVWIIWKLCDL